MLFQLSIVRVQRTRLFFFFFLYSVGRSVCPGSGGCRTDTAKKIRTKFDGTQKLKNGLRAKSNIVVWFFFLFVNLAELALIPMFATLFNCGCLWVCVVGCYSKGFFFYKYIYRIEYDHCWFFFCNIYSQSSRGVRVYVVAVTIHREYFPLAACEGDFYHSTIIHHGGVALNGERRGRREGGGGVEFRETGRDVRQK